MWLTILKTKMFGMMNIKAGLKYAYLPGADLSGVDFTDTKLKNANIAGAIFCNTKTPWGLDNSGCGE